MTFTPISHDAAARPSIVTSGIPLKRIPAGVPPQAPNWLMRPLLIGGPGSVLPKGDCDARALRLTS